VTILGTCYVCRGNPPGTTKGPHAPGCTNGQRYIALKLRCRALTGARSSAPSHIAPASFPPFPRIFPRFFLLLSFSVLSSRKGGGEKKEKELRRRETRGRSDFVSLVGLDPRPIAFSKVSAWHSPGQPPLPGAPKKVPGAARESDEFSGRRRRGTRRSD